MNVVIIGGNVRSLVSNRGDLIRHWKELGHKVYAIVPSADFSESIKDLDIDYAVIDLNRTAANPFSDLRPLVQLFRILREWHVDCVLSYNAKPVIYGSLAARLARVVSVYSMITGLGYSFAGNTFRQRLIRWLQSALYSFSLSNNKSVFFQNSDDRNDFVALGLISSRSEPVMIPGSGVNTQYFSSRPVLTHGGPLFVMISRLIIEKGVLEFAEAAQLLKRAGIDARFMLVGYHNPSLPTAVPLDRLNKYVADGVIEWPGGVEDVRPVLEQASVIVSPSYYREGVPRSLLEAMSVGRAIITTDMPGCRDTVNVGENGFLVEPRSTESLAAAMRKFIDDPDLAIRFGAASRALAVEKFAVEKVNEIITNEMGLS